MKFMHRMVPLYLAASLLSSCSQDAPWSVASGEGAISLKVEALNGVDAAVPAVRAVAAEIVPPPVSDLKISLVKEGGGYSKTWSSLADFAGEESFPVGNYTLSASYGDENSQGVVKPSDKGYEHAFYHGETSVSVREGETSSVQLTVSLANAVVVIEYADAFKKFFKSYKTIVRASGGEVLDLGDSEAMSYVSPGDLNITISAEQQNGKTLILNPATFAVEGHHMYKLRYNIYDGEIGDAKLAIEFDESLSVEPVVVNLSDELENTRPPLVSPVGFDAGASLVTISGTPYPGVMKFDAVADGGIAKALLTIKSANFQPTYLRNGEIDLCGATDGQIAEMEADGIKGVGFYRNVGKMGVLDLSELFRQLPEGVHSFSFQVSDKFSQTHEPVECSLSVVPVEMSAAGCTVPFGNEYADIRISYNGPDPTNMTDNPFTFTVDGRNGMPAECKIVSIEKDFASRSEVFPSHDYIYRIMLPSVELDKFDVGIHFNNASESCMSVPVEFSYPSYQSAVEFDAMATELRWRLDMADAEERGMYERRIRVFVGGDEKKSVFDSKAGAWVVSGLTPGETYEVRTTLQFSESPTLYGSTHVVEMEDAAAVPDGDFSRTHVVVDETLRVGGEWQAGLITYRTECHMKYSEPENWATVNAKTFYSGASNANTWFKVVSAYVENGNAVIRSVAYDHNGVTPSKTGEFASTRYYNPNPPASFQGVAAGELFIGDYSYDGSETRTYGIPFASRPKSFVFNYTYTTVDEDKDDEAYVDIELLSADGVSMVHKVLSLKESRSKSECAVDLSGYPFGKKASLLKIHFKSTVKDTPAVHIPSGDELNEGNGLGGKTITISQNSAHSLATGSVLTISDLRFDY